MLITAYAPLPVPYDTRHGGPYDRGSADAYYRRPYAPHYYAGNTGSTPRIEDAQMTEDDRLAYRAGYLDTVADGHHKEW